MTPLDKTEHTRWDDDLRIEFDTHLALIEDEERAGGASVEEARRNARARFGSPLVSRDLARARRQGDRLRLATVGGEPRVHTDHRADHRARHWRERVDLRRRAARRPQSPALSGLGPVDRPGSRRAAAQSALGHGHDAGVRSTRGDEGRQRLRPHPRGVVVATATGARCASSDSPSATTRTADRAGRPAPDATTGPARPGAAVVVREVVRFRGLRQQAPAFREATAYDQSASGSPCPACRCGDNAARYNFARRSSCALIATMTVLADMRTAANAGGRRIPCAARTPAANGIATML